MLQRIARLLRHRWVADARPGVALDALERVTHRVARSEALHSGEIRILIEAGLPNGYLLRPLDMPTLTRQRAVDLFAEWRVWDTEHNNGVLIYLLLAERAIELVSDRGINRHVMPQQWQALVQRLGNALRHDRWEDGLTDAIDEVTALLVMHFPLTADAINPNELPDAPALV